MRGSQRSRGGIHTHWDPPSLYTHRCPLSQLPPPLAAPKAEPCRGQKNLCSLALPGNRLEICVGNVLFLSPEQLLLLRILKDSATFCESRLFCTNFKDSVSMTQLINHHLREETWGRS